MEKPIFISYKRVDKERVFKIKDYIESETGLSCWIDLDGIESDAQYEDVIIDAIDHCEVFLFCYSSAHHNITNYENDWTIREINYAEAQNKRIVIINIDNSPLIRKFKFRFYLKQLIDACNNDNLDRLCKDLNSWCIPFLTSQRQKRVKKDTYIDNNFNEILDIYASTNYYQVIDLELNNCFWENNWNHHLLLMMAYKAIGDRASYSILLAQYEEAEILYYPQWYDFTSQVWDMIKFGFPQIALSHYNNGKPKLQTDMAKICYKVNRNHILLLEGKIQDSVNNYRDLSMGLNRHDRYALIIKDFNTLRWIGNYQLCNDNFEQVTKLLGFNPQLIYTSPVSSDQYEDILNKLEAHTWHLKEDKLHITLCFNSFNGIHNSIYYFEEYSQNLLGSILGALPFGLDESNNLLKNGRAFLQYRINKLTNKYILEEYDPIREEVYSGEIIKLTDKELHIRIIFNGLSSMSGIVRKYKSK